MFGCMFVFQVSGLQYKKFLAFPWILTVTWPVDEVSRCRNLRLPLLPALFPCILLSEFPSPTSGRRRVSADAVGPVRPLVPHRVLRLCVGAGGSVSALRHIRRLPDERRHLSPHRAVRLLRPSLQAHLHASRWRSRGKKLTCTSTEANK